ncbi:hypothetical protein BaRGS_00004376 [Batillaria attramentaria]|uniref:Uncharacterized protein n=1 Tax=Batillaria attramentaria TaxID=370345 RepID=A0ABD0LZ66_9CAEN
MKLERIDIICILIFLLRPFAFFVGDCAAPDIYPVDGAASDGQVIGIPRFCVGSTVGHWSQTPDKHSASTADLNTISQLQSGVLALRTSEKVKDISS